MIKFLLQRPIAVLMAFLACFIIGLVTYFTIPVSLLPDIAIPEITIQVAAKNTSARELENTVIKPIRQQLLQVANLRDLQSETRDGTAIIRLNFGFGTHTDLAFIEVNEKIDAAMNSLPRDIERPRVVKASATDIPVFCLNLTLREAVPAGGDAAADEAAFMALSQFAENVIKRRIEQLPEVAMVDITGTVKQQLRIVPDPAMLQMTGFTPSDLENILNANNIELGSMMVRDGHYEYNIKFSSVLRTPEDVENIYLSNADRIWQLKDLATVQVVPEQETGASFSNGKRAVTLAVIKQADENMGAMKKALADVTEEFVALYPDIDFRITRNQTQLLDYTISNLKQNLLIGFVLIFLVAILFLGDFKSPAIIGLTILVSLVICFLFFYLFNMSLNIISISGLILALGMMIDSSIIVTENIGQYRTAGCTLEEACIKGTTEVITPMLSSTFTTIAVFAPLVFVSGIAGAIFFDQAFAVTVGLLVSYFTGIMLLPVLYKLIYSLPDRRHKGIHKHLHNLAGQHSLDRFYDRGVDFIFRHKVITLICIALTLPLCGLLFFVIPKSRMPQIDQNELIAHIEWNRNIHLDENRQRTMQLFEAIAGSADEYAAYIGQQQFLLNRDRELSVSESELYFKTPDVKQIAPLQQQVTDWLKQHYPEAVVTFSPPVTLFEKLFVTGEADLVAELYPRDKTKEPESHAIYALEKQIAGATGYEPVGVAFDDQLNLVIDRQKLLLYRVDYSEVYNLLKAAFKENEVATLRSYQQYLPIQLVGSDQTINDILQQTLVKAQPDENGGVAEIPLQALVRRVSGEDLKTITAGRNGEFVPLSFYGIDSADGVMQEVRKQTAGSWEVLFSGSFFSNKQMLNELIVILLISILLMYFILAAQFESFTQPLIVLIEIPIDIAAALLVLWLAGQTMNLMSAIGIVVTCGIIINDSILKLDVINELRKAGMPLIEAIHEAGRRRLRPIIMTSLTTIFGMVPMLFTFDMGSELQKPLSIAMIAGMLIGTLVSLFLVPLVYWCMYQHKEKKSEPINE